MKSQGMLTADVMPIDEETLKQMEIAKKHCYGFVRDYKKSIEAFDAVLKKYPHNAEALFGLGKAYAALPNHQESAKYFWQVAESGDESLSVEAYLNLAKIYCYDIGNYEQTLICVTKVSVTDPLNAEMLLCKGKAHQALKQYDEALSAFKGLLILERNNVEALLQIGKTLTYNVDNHNGAAIKFLAQLLYLNPEHQEALFTQGKAYYNQSFANSELKVCAAQVFKSLKRINPNYRAQDVQKHLELLADGQQTMTKVDVMSIDDEASKNMEVAKEYCYGFIRNYQEAIKGFDAILKKCPHNTEALFGLGKAYAGLPNHQESAKYFLRVAESSDQSLSVEAYLNLAKIYCYDIKNYAEALTCAAKVLVTNPLNVEMLLCKGKAYYNQSFADSKLTICAVNTFKLLKDIDPNYYVQDIQEYLELLGNSKY